MSSVTTRYVLRDVTADDAALLAALSAARFDRETGTTEWDVAAHHGTVSTLQHAARERSYHEHGGLSDRLVLVDGRTVGRVIVAREPGRLRIVDVVLLPAYRGAGLGTAILRRVLEEAGETPVEVVVAGDNPARRAFERLGFTVVGAAGDLLTMRAPAPRAREGSRTPTPEGTGS